jgi:hypothetical protein
MSAAEALEAEIDRLLAEHPEHIQAIERAPRAAIVAAMPDVEERVDFGNKLLAFGRTMAMRDLMFAVIAHREHVNLQLADGVDLPDPTGIVESTGKRIRRAKCRSLAGVDLPAVRDLISARVAARS